MERNLCARKKTLAAPRGKEDKMTKEEFNMETIRCQLSYITELLESLPRNDSPAEQIPEYITIDLAAELKGGASANTYKTRYFLQPCAGTNSVKVGGRKCWRKQDVLEWLEIDDSHLEEYAAKYGVKIQK